MEIRPNVRLLKLTLFRRVSVGITIVIFSIVAMSKGDTYCHLRVIEILELWFKVRMTPELVWKRV